MLTPISFLAFTLLSVHQVFGWTTFVMPHNLSGGDDMPTLTVVFVSSNGTTRNLAVNSTIIFKKGITYNFFSTIRLPVLQNVEIRIEGNMSYGGYSGFARMTFTGGTNITLRGTSDREWGWIDGHGQAWWDAMEQTHCPHGIWFHNITEGTIRDMKIHKPVGWNYETTGSSNVHVFENTILAKSDTNVCGGLTYQFEDLSCSSLFHSIRKPSSFLFPLPLPSFGAQGTNQLFENNYVVNGDDCITITDGAVNITFRNAYCEGSHGLSTTVGSSSNNTFATGENFLYKSGLYSARFKSFTGGPGLTCNVTYRNIRFVDTVFPIYVTQKYSTGTRPVISANPDPNNATHIKDFLFENFYGTIRDLGPKEGSCISDPCWFFVANATGREVVILYLYPGTGEHGTTTNVRMKNIVAHTERGGEVDMMCSTVDVTNDVGFICQDGAFICTKAGI
ncbi:pectin lyase-like protein [Mycena olivaceomarginata]|nr:pectin lyase-like protein [Mycena olivaceomarginata]